MFRRKKKDWDWVRKLNIFWGTGSYSNPNLFECEYYMHTIKCETKVWQIHSSPNTYKTATYIGPIVDLPTVRTRRHMADFAVGRPYFQRASGRLFLRTVDVSHAITFSAADRTRSPRSDTPLGACHWCRALRRPRWFF